MHQNSELQISLLSNFSNLITVRLDDTNYVTWRFMLESMLIGCDLMGYIDGSVPCPSQYKTTTEAGITELTEEFKEWRKNDYALITLLAATLSSNALSFIVGSKTSKGVWYLLEDRYAKLSTFKAFELKTSMQKIQKGNDSVDKYMERFKSVRDQLSVAGIHIPDEDVVTFILDGLPAAFTTFKIVIRAQETPISLSQLHTLLLDFESDIVQESSSLVSTLVPTSVENESPGTHLTTQLAYVPQYTILPNNMSHVSSACTMNPSYAANTMVQNGYFGLPSMSSNVHMVTSTPNASVGSIVGNVGSITYPLGSSVVPTSEALCNGTIPQSNTSSLNIPQSNKVISWKSLSNAYGTNSHMQKSSYPNNEKDTKARDNRNSQTVYSLGDICQICSQFGHIALSCSQRPSPRQVFAIGCSLQCQVCLKTDHSAAECLHRHHYDFQPSIQEEPQTMIASSPIQSSTRSIPIESTLLSNNSSASKDNALYSATSVSSKISGWQHKMLKELAALSIQDTWLQQSALPCSPLMNCREICHERGMLQSQLIPPG